MANKRKLRTHLRSESPRSTPQTWLQIAQLRAEKCELKEARTAYFLSLQQAKKSGDLKATMESLAGLLRLASEALDDEAVEKWERELDRMMRAAPRQIPPLAWYCKGALARHRRQMMLAQRNFHRYLRMVRAEGRSEEAIVRGLLMLAVTLHQRHRSRRSEHLAYEILRRYEVLNFRGMNGTLYHLLGTLAECQRDYKSALLWYQKAHAQFLSEHNWYYLLYIMVSYARLERRKNNYSQAQWYLELAEKAVIGPEFGALQHEIFAERKRLEQDSVDLLIDKPRGVIKTREREPVSLRKQYVLIQILEALSKAHSRAGGEQKRGLSKAEIIEYVWKENYQPSIHDNKLYYNINRLRKLLEPNVHQPHYLLNWKEGYRLAPELRIHYIGHRENKPKGESS